MKRQQYRVLIVILLILAIVAAGVLLSDTNGRWFRKGSKGSLASVQQVTGDVSVLRDGMAYVLKKDIGLRQDDALVTGADAYCQASVVSEALVSIDGGSQIEMETLTPDGAAVRVTEGAAVFEAAEGVTEPKLQILADGVHIAMAEKTVMSVEAYHGTVTVSVFDGMPSMNCGERAYTLVPGDRVVVLNGEDAQTVSFNRIMSSDLREFLLNRLIEKGGLLFEPEQLQAVLDKRRAETETIAVPSDTEGLTCTLEIRCDAVLDHLDELDPEKANAIPESGIVLPATRVSFTSGDSAYDILRRTCLSNGIEISYDYAVNLSGYYIENLAGLAERECGPQSGWMYKVNGWFPNYGSSRYQVCDGDVIVWSYSCVGLGEDIGVEPWQSAEKSEITTEIK